MKETLRTAYNSIIYVCLRTLFFWSRNIEFFPDANGWSLTFRYKTLVYKCFSPLFLFHPFNTFAKFISFHKHISTQEIIKYIPSFHAARFFVAYEYIPHTQNLIQYLLEESVSEKRLEILARVFTMLDSFHSNHIIHGDMKPKNILVAPDGRLYAIDFENSFISDSVADRITDYGKFIPRIVYLFTVDELRPILATCSESLRTYLEQYLEPFEIRLIIQPVPGLQFERRDESPEEDIDVIIPDTYSLNAIRTYVEQEHLDYRLFFRSRSDVKCYVYNLSGIRELDVHLSRPMFRAMFLREKLVRHPALQVAITGPDGVGKTTLISEIVEHSKDIFLRQIPKSTLHASRFVRENNRIVTKRPWTLTDKVLARIRWGLIGRLVAYERLLQRNVIPILLLDRSFYDPYLQSPTKWGYRFISFYRFFFPRNIRTILLHATPAIIQARKSQLSEDAIVQYYKRAADSLPICATIDANGDSTSIQQHTETILRFFALTEERFLP